MKIVFFHLIQLDMHMIVIAKADGLRENSNKIG